MRDPWDGLLFGFAFAGGTLLLAFVGVLIAMLIERWLEK